MDDVDVDDDDDDLDNEDTAACPAVTVVVFVRLLFASPKSAKNSSGALSLLCDAGRSGLLVLPLMLLLLFFCGSSDSCCSDTFSGGGGGGGGACTARMRSIRSISLAASDGCMRWSGSVTFIRCCCCRCNANASAARRCWIESSFFNIDTWLMASRQRDAKFMFSIVSRVTFLVSSRCRTRNSLCPMGKDGGKG